MIRASSSFLSMHVLPGPRRLVDGGSDAWFRQPLRRASRARPPSTVSATMRWIRRRRRRERRCLFRSSNPSPDQIAYYKAEHGSGIFAPKGWYCRAWNGSNGSFLAVTPKPIPPPYFPLPSISGPAVTIATWDGESSGRVRVAVVASQLFSVAGTEFIARVRQEHLISESAFDPESYPDDQLQYLSDRFVEYTTPPNHTGLGTDSMFEASNLPIRGLTILNLADEANSLIEVRVRLPPNLEFADRADSERRDELRSATQRLSEPAVKSGYRQRTYPTLLSPCGRYRIEIAPALKSIYPRPTSPS